MGRQQFFRLTDPTRRKRCTTVHIREGNVQILPAYQEDAVQNTGRIQSMTPQRRGTVSVLHSWG